MSELADGEETQVIGNLATYTLRNVRGAYSCSCPAWVNQVSPIFGPRTCKHIDWFRADGRDDQPRPHDDGPQLRAEREAALETALALSPVLSDRMEEVFGLQLPHDVAYAAGFLLGLTADERADLELFGVVGLIGVGAWFEGATLTRAPGGDERLRDRRREDPPELVPVIQGLEGERWGLWYDDSRELPSGVTGLKMSARTVLEMLVRRLKWTGANRDAPLVRWFDEVVRRERVSRRRDDGNWEAEECPIPLLAGLSTPYVPGSDRADLYAEASWEARMKAYNERAPVVEEWIEEARARLRDGSAARAICLGRDLHRMGAPEYRYACTELLIRGYSALGRGALADIVRVVYRHHEPDLAIYELPPPHPAVAAAASEDIDAIARGFDESGPPTPDDLDLALATASSVAAIDALLDRASLLDIASTDAPLVRRLQTMYRHGAKPDHAAHHRALLLRLLERGTVTARAFERLLWRGDRELITAAAARVDVTSTIDGATPLHLAARNADAEAVRTLLKRGADPRARNAAGRMPYDGAREAQAENPLLAGAAEILAVLQAAGAGITRPPAPAGEVEYAEGDAVHHGKLGDGVVASVTGEGTEAKLKICFANETRVLLAKFVTPRPAP